MISDKDIEKLKKTFVTKDDLKNELRAFATKDDLRFYATKDALDRNTEILMGVQGNTNYIIKTLGGMVKSYDELKIEYYSLKVSDERQNRHIKQLAHATGTELTP